MSELLLVQELVCLADMLVPMMARVLAYLVDMLEPMMALE